MGGAAVGGAAVGGAAAGGAAAGGAATGGAATGEELAVPQAAGVSPVSHKNAKKKRDRPP